MNTQDREEVKSHFHDYVLEGKFLDIVNQRQPAQTYTAGQSYSITLSSLNDAEVPFILACLRASVTGSGL